MTDAPELLPCPFCGGEAHVYTTYPNNDDTKVQIQCAGCIAEIALCLSWTAGNDEKVAAMRRVVFLWNTRPDHLQAMVAAERARCVDLVNFAFSPYGTKGERLLCDNIIAAIQEGLK